MRKPTRVKCQRCYTEFAPKVHAYPTSESGEFCINCPTCFRGYFFDEENGQWCSDRPLLILEHEEE